MLSDEEIDRWGAGNNYAGTVPGLRRYARAIESAATAPLLARIAEQDALIAKLRLEAQIHAQEARTANATIAEIYQSVTGGTGEPCNWHGAAPVKARIAELTRELEEARKDAEMLDWLDNNIFAREPDEWDQRYGVCRDGKTQMWAIFAPKGVHGSARKIIAAAIKEQT